MFRFESSLLLLTEFCNFSHLTFSAISTLSGGMTSICSKSSSRRFSMFVSICRVLRIQSMNINTLRRNNTTHILLFLSPKKLFKYLEYSTIKLVLLGVVNVLAITNHCFRGVDKILQTHKRTMDVKQACFYLADRAFLVTDYKDFTETEAGDRTWRVSGTRPLSGTLACSQTLYFFFKARWTRVIKSKNRGGFIERQRKG